MEPHDVFNKLQNCQNDILIFRKLISTAPLHDSTGESVKEWQTILAHIIELISNNSELGNERILLACHAFYALLPTQCDSHALKDIIIGFQKLDSCNLCFLEKQYTVSDLELFKLLNAYGYLQVNRKNVLETCFEYDALLIMFDVIYRNCMKYTRYTYFAYRVLSVWLKRLRNTTDERFWNKQNCILEQKLEAIIFSNWSNVLNNLCKQNAEIFNMYLRIMLQKHKRTFIDNVYQICLQDMSWQNETKYIILTEILQVHDIKVQTMQCFLFELCNSLTKISLRCGGTKLYMTILRKLNEAEWKEMFGEVMKFVINRWESGKHVDHNALQSLFIYWLEPTIEMYRNILPFLWELCGNTQGYFFRSHLQRMAAKIHVELPRMYEIDRDNIDNKEEIIRLNAFAVLCYRAVELINNEADTNEADPFLLIKQFLWFNANTATILMREGIIKYFRILCSNILKAFNIKTDCVLAISEFMNWLHKYFLDCFEIGSCYQRKILALNLYRTLLSFTNKSLYKNYTRKKCLHNIVVLDKYLKTTDSSSRLLKGIFLGGLRNLCRRFTNKESLFLLLRLVLDSAIDVRQLASTLILEYFGKDALSTTEKRILYNCAWEHCNSSKFYKIESGAILVKIIAHWLPLNKVSNEVSKNIAAAIFSDNEYNNILVYSSYSEFLLNEAKCQLADMKCDILKAIVKNRPFYGVLTALLAVAFRSGPENWVLTPQFTEKMLSLLKDAVEFFLSTFSTKASNTVYSSSFAEMGLAIDEKIKTSEIEDFDYDQLQLSPAHQILISCIWMSLKISCEIASEIGMLIQSNAHVKRSIDIIVMVLLKCRHKGVVESAGVTIANLSKCLYNEEKYSELPKIYLTCLLEEDTKKSLHLTRRGAGLSIMFHKLIVSDNRNNRPTVHFAVETLLHSLKNVSVTAVRNVETGEDSPWAKRLHFLRTLVADKEIHAQLVPYMEDICLTCFKYMESDVWTVRNASLQLYGAVVPRLVGQCTRKGDEAFDFGDGYSVNHFITHYPMLTSHMWAQLRDISKIRGTSNTALRSYSSVVHTLIVLSKLSTSGCDLVDYPARIFATKFKHLLFIFLGNPMIHVRQLAAKAYTALTPFNKTNSEIKAIRQKILSSHDNNMSHGCLLTCKYLREKFIHDTRSLVHEIKEDYGKVYWTGNLGNSRYFNIIETWNNMRVHKKVAQPCYILETLFLQEASSHTHFTDTLSFHYNLPITECIVSSQKIQPGFFQFVGYCEQLLVAYFKTFGSKFDDFEQTAIRNILNSSCTEQGIEFLKSLSHCAPLLEFILKYLTSIRSNYHQLLLDEIITFTLRTIRHTSLELRNSELWTNKLEFDEIIEKFKEVARITNSNIARVKNSLILAFSKREILINEVLLHVSDICMDEKQSVRLMAAEYLELVLHRFAQVQDSNKLIIMRCCLILLKDEIAEIREIMSTLLQMHVFKYTNSASRRLQHEEIVYQRLLSLVIRHHIADNSVEFIQYFTHAIQDGDSNVTIENPFHHNDSIFHKEESKFLNICFLHDSSDDDRNSHENSSDVVHAIETRRFRKLQEKAGFSYDDLRVILYLKEIDYMVQKRDIIIQQWK
ncbi:Thyroid adenoma-associated protein like protein [Trachymyrmex zeteki]|uniref:Thyroid adenoma-associated protein like protein n=2 Tax=Mycetomoellerius zeteki TaxID=64791 RepID=A0A151XD39_9HYME|nr:Thyroid adenoma-associated protein like protein [Trachymyrmex zeteki]